MKFSPLSLLSILAIVAACGGSGPPAADLGQQTTSAGRPYVLPSDEDILAKAYDVGYSVPEGFYVDDRAETTRSYTVHHVLDESQSYEVCSDDLVEAQALEDADNRSRAVNGYYVTSHETDRYFEFVRELNYTQAVGHVDDITSPGYGRVFKCSYARRDGVDRTLVDGYSGRINADRLNSATLREFTEYLWQFRFFDVSQKKVIDSYATTGTTTLRHTLLLALMVSQGADRCDRIDVIEWHFDADAASGDVSRQFAVSHSFEATLSGGIPTFCQ